ncbi:MAG: hypothetical protein E7609_02710 [Ruminococcaceae bacterium]|nr:hypothetical protein [Oscillospiraceae bacterium]
MKKALAILLALLLSLSCLFACSAAPKINKESWALVSVTKNEDFLYIASSYADAAPGVPTLDCTLTANRGSFTITELASGKTYTGTYGEREELGIVAEYTITVENRQGNALVSHSEDEDGNLLTTLVLHLGDYALLFVAQ